MNKKQLILFNTFSFILVIPLLILIELLVSNYKLNFGFTIGWIIGNIINRFWSKPIYIDNIDSKNGFLRIEYLSPLLKKGIDSYAIEEIIDVRIKNKSRFTKIGSIELKFNDVVIKYTYLKMDNEYVLKAVNKLVDNKHQK